MATSDPTSPELTGIRLDATSLRVLAHPLRSRLLVPPAHRGAPPPPPTWQPRSAPTPGATSYHLRKLEAVGLVADTGEGEGKRRLWRAATDFHSYYPSDFAGDEDSETALNWLSRDYVRHFSDAGRALGRRLPPAGPSPGRTPAAAATTWSCSPQSSSSAMRDEIGEVVARYRRVGQGNPEAKRIAVYLFAYALDLENGPTR